MIFDRLDRNPTRRALVVFGATIFAMAVVAGSLLYFRAHHEAAVAVVCAGAAVFAVSPVRAIARPIYIAWMGLGLVLRAVTSPIILLVVYLVVFTPLALLFRLLRRDALRRKLDPAAATYWEARQPSDDPASYLRQY